MGEPSLVLLKFRNSSPEGAESRTDQKISLPVHFRLRSSRQRPKGRLRYQSVAGMMDEASKSSSRTFCQQHVDLSVVSSSPRTIIITRKLSAKPHRGFSSNEDEYKMKKKGTQGEKKEPQVLMLMAPIPESTEADTAAASNTEENDRLVYRGRPHPLNTRKLLKYGDRRRPRRLPKKRRKNVRRVAVLDICLGHFLKNKPRACAHLMFGCIFRR